MIVGETKNLTRIETEAVAFSITSPTASVLDPTGTPIDPPTVSVAPGGTATTQTSTITVTPALGGPYRVIWNLPVGTEVWKRVVPYFATFTDPYTVVRNLLQTNTTIVPDSLIDLHLGIINTRILQLYPTSITNYENMSTATFWDQQNFDNALGYMVAARIRPFIPKSIATGELISYEGMQDKFKYGDHVKGLDPLETQWLAEAATLLASVTILETAFKAWQTEFQTIAFAGKRRLLDRTGHYVTAIQGLRAILLDQYYFQGILPDGITSELVFD